MRLGTAYRLEIMPHLGLPEKAGRALDIGCHDGAALARIHATEKWGIDIELNDADRGATYIEGDFLTHPFGEMQFDLITAFDVIEHVEDHSAFLAKIEVLLTEGGVAILTTPSDRIRVFPGFLQAWIDKRWGHVYRRGYSPSFIKQLCAENAPLLGVTVTSWDAPAFRASYFPLSILWRAAPAIGRAAVRSAAKHDARRRDGDRGYWLIHLRKRPTPESRNPIGGA